MNTHQTDCGCDWMCERPDWPQYVMGHDDDDDGMHGGVVRMYIVVVIVGRRLFRSLTICVHYSVAQRSSGGHGGIHAQGFSTNKNIRFVLRHHQCLCKCGALTRWDTWELDFLAYYIDWSQSMGVIFFLWALVHFGALEWTPLVRLRTHCNVFMRGFSIYKIRVDAPVRFFIATGLNGLLGDCGSGFHMLRLGGEGGWCVLLVGSVFCCSIGQIGEIMT